MIIIWLWIYLKLLKNVISKSICICHLQTEDSSIHQLEGEFQSVISALRSKLNSRSAPPVLHLDTVYLQEDSSNTDPSAASSTGAPVHTGPSSSQESQEPWSLLTALKHEIQKSSSQDDIMTEDASQSEISFNTDTSPDVKWSTTSEDFTFVESEERTELKSSESISAVQPVTEGAHTETTADPRRAVKTLSLRRHYRSLLRKRQIPGASGKSRYRTKFRQNIR